MKKYFSLALLMAMVLTLVSTVPAQAALDNTYPYIFYDFNQETAGKGSGSGWNTMITSWATGQGVDGTGALKVVDKNNANDTVLKHNLLDKESISRDSYTISGWVKVVHADKYNSSHAKIDANNDGQTDQWEFINDVRIGTILNYGYRSGSSVGVEPATKFSNISVSNMNDGKWHYFTQTYAKGGFTGASATKVYDWTTNVASEFQLRMFTDPALCDSRFNWIFKSFDTNNSNHNVELLYYMDDYQYVPVVSDTIVDGSVPVVTLTSPATLASNVVGDTVNVSWTHTPSNVATSSKVVVRLFKKIVAGGEYATNGWVLVDQQYTTANSYSLPLTEDMLWSSYKIEIFPYDKTSNSYRPGAIKTVEMTRPVSTPEVITPKADTPITFTAPVSGNDGKVTFELAEVTNNTSATLDLFTIIALYNSNGGLMKCVPIDLPTLVGVGSLPAANLINSVTLTDAEYAEVAVAKAFVWSGSDFSDDTADHIAYTAVQRKEK